MEFAVKLIKELDCEGKLYFAIFVVGALLKKYSKHHVCSYLASESKRVARDFYHLLLGQLLAIKAIFSMIIL